MKLCGFEATLVYIEFQARQDYIMRPYLKIKERNVCLRAFKCV